MGKEAIIDKILSDAQLRAEAMVGEAKNKADATLAEAANGCKRYIEQSRFDTDKAVEEIAARGRAVAELDAKKLQLKAKAEILDKVFSTALEKAKNLDKKAYSKLVLGMLAQAEDGDVVTVSSREKGIITQKAVDDLAKSKGIKLTLNKALGDFDGGIILTGGGVDKNFTLEVEFALLRDAVETDIAKEIFADVR